MVSAHSRATKIDSQNQYVHLSDGRVITFDKLLLATGGRPATWVKPLAATPKSLCLTFVDDAQKLRTALLSAQKLHWWWLDWLRSRCFRTKNGY